MDVQLERVIRSQPLTLRHIRVLIYQLLKGLQFLHSAEIVHGDIRPSNILLNASCHLKICGYDHINENHNEWGGYYEAKCYFAPEKLLSIENDSYPVDLWSVGCIFAELLCRRVFFPGHNYVFLITKIMETVGRPPDNEFDFIDSVEVLRFIQNQKIAAPPLFISHFPNYQDQPEVIYLVRRLLDFHPRARYTIADALKHPFLNLEVDENEFADYSVAHIDIPLYDYEDKDYSSATLQSLLTREIHSFQQPL